MIFTDFAFVPFILVVLFVANVLLKGRGSARMLFLTIASYAFYASWNWQLSGLILLSTIIDYFLGRRIHAARGGRARLYLFLSLAANLGILGFFKYANFFLDNVNGLFGSAIPHLNILLPVGISFYTFQTMSYSIDIYRRKLAPEKSFLRFAFFVSFFPQLVAGPIVRASEFLPQTHRKKVVADFSTGVQVFFYGVVKKVVIADQLAFFVDAVFALPEVYSSVTIWLAVIAYALQIYFDFAGYSDMAIGVARMLGYDLVENFNLPYVSLTITEFWRRWHMSLSRWIKDYIYISLGGNRVGLIRMFFNLLLTMLLGGLWHGASWNFVVWGGLHGVALSLEKLFGVAKKRYVSWWGKACAWVRTMLIVLVSWVFFRAEDFTDAFYLLRRMFFDFTPGTHWVYFYLLLWIVPIVFFHIYGVRIRAKTGDHTPYRLLDLKRFWQVVVFFVIILGCVVFLPVYFQPFIYFQF